MFTPGLSSPRWQLCCLFKKGTLAIWCFSSGHLEGTAQTRGAVTTSRARDFQTFRLQCGFSPQNTAFPILHLSCLDLRFLLKSVRYLNSMKSTLLNVGDPLISDRQHRNSSNRLACLLNRHDVKSYDTRQLFPKWHVYPDFSTPACNKDSLSKWPKWHNNYIIKDIFKHVMKLL